MTVDQIQAALPARIAADEITAEAFISRQDDGRWWWVWTLTGRGYLASGTADGVNEIENRVAVICDANRWPCPAVRVIPERAAG